MAERQGIAVIAMPTTAVHIAAMPAMIPCRFAVLGDDLTFAAASPARMRSGVNGNSRKRTPVASKIALAIAAALGTDADSPTPSGGWSGRGIISTSMFGMSGNVMIG